MACIHLNVFWTASSGIRTSLSLRSGISFKLKISQWNLCLAFSTIHSPFISSGQLKLQELIIPQYFVLRFQKKFFKPRLRTRVGPISCYCPVAELRPTSFSFCLFQRVSLTAGALTGFFCAFRYSFSTVSLKKPRLISSMFPNRSEISSTQNICGKKDNKCKA